jgi:hypothetical protein
MLKTRNHRLPGLALVALAALVSVAHTASASAFTDIPEAFGDALGVTDYVAKMILAIAGLTAVTIWLAALRMRRLEGYLIIQLCVIGLFTVIGWLDEWILVLAGVLIAVLFAGKVKAGLG